MSQDALSSSDGQLSDGIDLTIVVPVYNRAALIGRCLRSCLAQAGENVEVIVVDDASTDDSVAAVRAFSHPRMSVLVQERNKGVCSARGRGVSEARGEWVAFVDSDDELAGGAIDTLLAAIRECPEDCGAIYHRDLHADGVVSPVTVPRYGKLRYEDYIELMNVNLHRYKDVFQCMRASALKEVPWPENRAPETEFHLNFVRRFPVLMREPAIYLVHDDADARLSTAQTLSPSRSEAELERLHSLERIIDDHGDALRAHGPALWEHMLTNLISLEAIFGRKEKMRELYSYGIRNGGRKSRLVPVFAAGFLGPKVIVKMRFWYKRLRALAALRKPAST